MAVDIMILLTGTPSLYGNETSSALILTVEL